MKEKQEEEEEDMANDFVYDFDASVNDPRDKNAWFAATMFSRSRVLEVGCATGYVGEYLNRSLNCEIVGVEVFEDAATKARSRGCYTDVLTADIEDPATFAKLPVTPFDYVIFGDVLEHLVSPQATLEAVAGVLAPAGRVLICLPNIVHWSMRARVLAGRFDYTDTGLLDRTHLRFFTPATGRALIEESGYRVVNHGGVVWLPQPIRRLCPGAWYESLERLCGRVAPSLFFGQALFEAVPSVTKIGCESRPGMVGGS